MTATDKPTTLILGATPNPSRYAYIAAERLKRHGHPFVPVGIKQGTLQGIEIQQGTPDLEDIDTVTLYVGPRNQEGYLDWLIDLQPRRIVFNPGTENPVLMQRAREADIEVVTGCTLVMLGSGQY